MSYSEVKRIVKQSEFERIEEYISLLAKWRKVTNLISENGFADIWGRHILDGVLLHDQSPVSKTWVDFGSGAGLPSVLLAIFLLDIPGAKIHCVEIDRRKCAFLREVASTLELPLKIHNAYAESLDPSKISDVEVVTARAFSSVERILAIAHPFLATGAVAILPRGRRVRSEIAQLPHASYTVGMTPNLSSEDGVFVRIELRAAPRQ